VKNKFSPESRRQYEAKEQRARILRGEITIQPRDLIERRIVRITDYKARKARQAIWENAFATRIQTTGH
jgi:hypothetical protein